MSIEGGETPEQPSESRESEPDEFSEHFAGRFDHLLTLMPSPSGVQWTNAGFAEALNELGVVVGRNYIAQLRTGRRVSPSPQLLTAIARLLKVKVEYFFDDTYAQNFDRDLALLIAVRRAGMEKIALRASELSADSLIHIADTVEYARRREGLKDDPDATSPPTEH